MSVTFIVTKQNIGEKMQSMKSTNNYTGEQTTQMVAEYESNPCRETVEILAEKFSKSPKSIIGKLSREGVYRRAIYKSKTGEHPITKVELVTNIADNLGVEIDSLEGLDKAPKSTLKNLKVATGSE